MNSDSLSYTNIYVEENGIKQYFKLNYQNYKQLLPCIITFVLLISTSTCYFLLVLPEVLVIFSHNITSWYIIVIGQSIIFVYTVATFLCSMSKDPGKFPKENIDDSSEDTKALESVLIKNIEIQTKWCEICNFYRPLRSFHCEFCDSCIDQYDRKSYNLN